MFRTCSALLLVCLVASAESAKPRPASKPSRLHIDAATLTTGAGVPVILRNLDAELAPKELQPKPPTIQGGTAYLTSESLSRLIKSKMQTDGLKDLSVETMRGGRAKISGKMEKAGIPVPVSVEGPVSLTSNGLLTLKLESKKAGVFPLDLLAKVFGVNMEEKVSNRSVQMTKDQLTVDPRALIGVTASGTVTGVSTDERGMTLRFGPPKPQRPRTGRK
jgi:hypothetical protein